MWPSSWYQHHRLGDQHHSASVFAGRMTSKRKTTSPTRRIVRSKLGYCMMTTMVVLDNLDDDLLGEILTRLPAKTLAQLKVINKRWYSLISNPSFVNKHTRLQTNQDAPSFFREISHYLGNVVRLSFDPSSPSILSETIISLHLPIELEKNYVFTTHSCHGLLLLTLTNQSMFVFNPSTKKKQFIPSPKKIPRRYHREFVLAFGQASSSYYYNHYNVVCLLLAETAFQFKIFSPEIGRWRDADKSTMISYGNGLNSESLCSGCTPVCFRGSIHWLTKEGHIMAFDVVKEETRMIEMPKGITEIGTVLNTPWWWRTWLGVVEDEVNLVLVTPKHEITTWVLHDYDNKQWKIKRTDVIKADNNRTIIPIFFDGERFVLAVITFREGGWGSDSKGHWQEYNIRTGVLGPLCRRNDMRCFPYISSLTEVCGSNKA